MPRGHSERRSGRGAAKHLEGGANLLQNVRRNHGALLLRECHAAGTADKSTGRLASQGAVPTLEGCPAQQHSKAPREEVAEPTWPPRGTLLRASQHFWKARGTDAVHGALLDDGRTTKSFAKLREVCGGIAQDFLGKASILRCVGREDCLAVPLHQLWAPLNQPKPIGINDKGKTTRLCSLNDPCHTCQHMIIPAQPGANCQCMESWKQRLHLLDQSILLLGNHICLV
mmetsp:Transcript_1606/g.3328  ORF Transcript_1606/g.3328 Transcript_1606/m.3328 type:complete len:228 (+) Transcript_1606:82-765(+)